ncbi:MAG: class I SAM-dependent methyltransferase [Methyloceanibacter sp.]|jgi:SAM-dependent methyltransferase
MGKKGIIRNIRRGNFAKVLGAMHPGCHQPMSKTALNRYPEIFAAAAAALPNARRILSFGCSSGEECATLEKYFPNAEIVGADVNLLSLAKAMRYWSRKIRFVYATDHTLSRLGGFDAVFCMAVLRNPRKKLNAGRYPFERFEERARFLETLLRPGGILVIHNSNYRFGDVAHQYAYERIPFFARHDRGLFLPDGITEVDPDSCLFRRLDS